MWCSIYKWNISRALDSGRTPGGWTRRHLEKCASCREFSRLSHEMGKQLAADASSLIASGDSSLAGRMMPASPAALGNHDERLCPAPGRLRLSRWRPVWAAAASLAIVVGVSLIWTLTSHPAKIPPLSPLVDLEGPRAYLLNALEKAESPYHEEVAELKQALQSAADYLINRLDVNLGPKN